MGGIAVRGDLYDLIRHGFAAPPSPEGEGFPKQPLFPKSANITVNEYNRKIVCGHTPQHRLFALESMAQKVVADAVLLTETQRRTPGA